MIVAVLGALGVINYIKKVWSPLVLGSMIMPLAVNSLGAYGSEVYFIVGIILAFLCGYLSIKGKDIWATLAAIFTAVGKFDWSISQSMPFFTYPLSFPPLELLFLMTIVAFFNAMLS